MLGIGMSEVDDVFRTQRYVTDFVPSGHILQLIIVPLRYVDRVWERWESCYGFEDFHSLSTQGGLAQQFDT